MDCNLQQFDLFFQVYHLVSWKTVSLKLRLWLILLFENSFADIFLIKVFFQHFEYDKET